jgi:hypothetical protein
VAIGTEIDDAPGSRIFQQRHQAQRQLDMTEVVDAELNLESVRRLLVRSEHHAGVVDEDVDAREPCADLDSGRTHACQAVQLQLDCLDRGGGASVVMASAADRDAPSRPASTTVAPADAGPCVISPNPLVAPVIARSSPQINAGKNLVGGPCHTDSFIQLLHY